MNPVAYVTILLAIGVVLNEWIPPFDIPSYGIGVVAALIISNVIEEHDSE